MRKRGETVKNGRGTRRGDSQAFSWRRIVPIRMETECTGERARCPRPLDARGPLLIGPTVFLLKGNEPGSKGKKKKQDERQILMEVPVNLVESTDGPRQIMLSRHRTAPSD